MSPVTTSVVAVCPSCEAVLATTVMRYVLNGCRVDSLVCNKSSVQY